MFLGVEGMGAGVTTTRELTQTHSGVDLHAAIDELEQVMLGSGELLDMPLVHRFTPGMYIREIYNPAGALITTKVHKLEHPFVLMRGSISTFVPEDGGKVEHLRAPHVGITKAGTRRVILVHEDAVFITFHPNPTNTRDLAELEDMLIERRTMPGSDLTANQLYKELLGGRVELAVAS